MGGGGGGDQTTRTEPWAGQQPYLRDLFGQAQNLYRQGGPQYFPGQTVASFSPQSQMGMDMLTQRALGGDPSMQAFGDYLTSTLSGGNVDPAAIAAGGQQAASGIGAGQNLMQQAGQAGPSFGDAASMFGVGGDIDLPGAAQFAGGAVGPYAQTLQGMTGYGGLGEASQFFGQPDALPASSMDQLGATASGQFLGSNPYLDQVFDTAAGRVQERFTEDILPGLDATFGAGGRAGSGLHALASGRAAGDAAQELAGLAGDIYAPAYEAERGRQLQAAQAGGQLGLGAGQLGLGHRQSAADLYGTERGLAQSAAQAAGQLGLGGGQLASQLYGQGTQADLSRLGMASDLYSGGLDRTLSAGQGLGQLGLGGLDAMSGLYGDIAQNQFRAGSLAPSFQQMQYGDIDQLMRVGGMTEDQAQRLIDADMQRWNFGQQQPWQNLSNYANIIQGLPGGYGTSTQSGGGPSRLSGALGGAATGFGIGGPIGAGIGGLIGLLG